MNASDIQTAVSELVAAMSLGGSWGTLEPATDATISIAEQHFSLPPPLRGLYALGDPPGFEIPWSAEILRLYSVADLYSAQSGYRYAAGRPNSAQPDWEPAWVVIGDISADPIIVDASKSAAPVFVAAHGMGAWSPKRVSTSLPDFLGALALWLRLWLRAGGEIHDAEGLLRADIITEFSALLATHLTDPERLHLLEFFE